MLRVAVVDDHPVARHGMVAVLAAAPDIEVVAAVPHPDELLAGALDVLVLDLYLDGEEPALAQIARFSGDLPVLVMSASSNPLDVFAAVQMGAAGYLTKHAHEADFVAAVRSVAAGGFHLSPHLADLLHAAASFLPAPPGRPTLSQREQEVLAYIARGFTHDQTATRMGIRKSTVDTYVVRIRAKLHVGNKAELALAALRYMRWRSQDEAGPA